MPRIILSDRGTFLGKTGEQFRVLRKDEPEILIPARKVDQILVLGSGISVSSDAIEMANELGVEIASSAFYNRLDERIHYQDKSQLLRNIIRSQASSVATFLRGERPRYEPFTPRW